MGNRKPTSSAGHYEHKGDPNALGHTYTVYAAEPSKDSGFYRPIRIAYTVFFLFLWGVSAQLTSAVSAFVVSLLVMTIIYRMATRNFRDKRVHAYDTVFYFNTAHLVAYPDPKDRSNALDVPMRDIEWFYVRPTTRSDSSSIPATFQPSGTLRTALISGVGGEVLMGTSVLPGTVGLATGAVAGAVDAGRNVLLLFMHVVNLAVYRARERHKVKIALHSFVFEIGMKDGKRHILAGGLNEETATQIMKEVSRFAMEDSEKSRKEIELRTREHMEAHSP